MDSLTGASTGAGGRAARKAEQRLRLAEKEAEASTRAAVKKALAKAAAERSVAERHLLHTQRQLVLKLTAAKTRTALAKKRREEAREDATQVDDKVLSLAALLRRSTSTVWFTGAGISTSSDIPDYRGVNGIRTCAQAGRAPPRWSGRLLDARPTPAHMALVALQRRGFVSHLVSQNIDGLHVRSGFPRAHLSEVHGNAFVETCARCGAEYLRGEDVSGRSAFRRHRTGRRCARRDARDAAAALCEKDEDESHGDAAAAADGVGHGEHAQCGGDLVDTIVHFGEKGSAALRRWAEALDASRTAELVVVLGSSLSVMRHYPLWSAVQAKRARLVIVNLQWTCKDKGAALVIREGCDCVLQKLLVALGLGPPPTYQPHADVVLMAAGQASMAAAAAAAKNEPLSSDERRRDDPDGDSPSSVAEQGTVGAAQAGARAVGADGAVGGWFARSAKRRKY